MSTHKAVSGGKTYRQTVREEFEGCITEIGANRTLTPTDDYNKGFNEGCDEAIKFIRRYIAGEGLFQS